MGFSDPHPTPYMPRHGNLDTSHGQVMPSMMNPPAKPPANPIGFKGSSHIFFKTRLCANFSKGSCKNGPNCRFAHGFGDLREPPPNWQELARDGGSRGWDDDQRIHTLKICRRFYYGEECPYGKSCNFIHERPTKNSADSGGEWSRANVINPYQRESDVIRTGTQVEDEKSNSDALVMKNAYWKTKLCSKWQITGQCPFGETCHFAHGHSELHVPSVRVEDNFSAIQVRSSMVSIIDPSPSIDIGAQTMVVGEDKKFPRWKPKKKINTIYGDWLDDLTPLHASPDEVEN